MFAELDVANLFEERKWIVCVTPSPHPSPKGRGGFTPTKSADESNR